MSSFPTRRSSDLGEVLAGADPHACTEEPGEVEGTVSGMLREVRDVEGRGVLVREAQHGGEPVLRARERERGHGWKCTAPPGQPRRARRAPGRSRRGTGRTSGTAPP